MAEPSILIAEDDDDLRDMLKDAVTKGNRIVYATKDGAEALKMLQKIRPALVILDLELPHMDGESLIREIMSNPQLRTTRMIVATGSPAAYIRQFERVAELVLQKPYQLEPIKAAVDRVLDDCD